VVAGEDAEVMHPRAEPVSTTSRRSCAGLSHQVLVHRRQRQHCRQGDVVAIDLAVADDEDVVAAPDHVDALGAQRGELGLHLGAPGERIGDVELVA
jgi:hypothetical protein